MNKDYSDIINLDHHVSKTRKQMSLHNRAAQFAPFAALSGYEDSLYEEARITNQKPKLLEEQKIILNEKLRCVLNSKDLEVEFIYFIKDNKKAGGKISSRFGIIKKIDDIEKNIILTDKTTIHLADLLDIKSNVFNQYD